MNQPITAANIVDAELDVLGMQKTLDPREVKSMFERSIARSIATPEGLDYLFPSLGKRKAKPPKAKYPTPGTPLTEKQARRRARAAARSVPGHSFS